MKTCTIEDDDVRPLDEQTDWERITLRKCEHFPQQQVCNQIRLQQLDVLDCSSLQQLPDSIGQLSALLQLHVWRCSSLQQLPDSIGALSALQQLNVGDCSSLQQLPDSIGALSALQELDVRGCSSLQQLPDSIGALSALQQLIMSGCSSLQQLPDSIGQLSALQELHVWRCSSLQQLPDSIGQLSALLMLAVGGCSSLQQLPDSIGALSALQRLNVLDCSSLQQLPDSIGALSALQQLHVWRCSSLQQLPDSIGALSALQRLYTYDCSSLQQLPDSIGALSALQQLNVRGCSSLQQLPDSIGQLSALQELDVRGCSSLQQLPDSIGQLSALQHLYTLGCSSLQQLPDSIGALSALQQLAGDIVPLEATTPIGLRGGDDDGATFKDSLGVAPVAKGTASFLLHPDTAATAMAVYGKWGSGKSSFMKQVELEMLLQAAEAQVDGMEPAVQPDGVSDGVLHTEFEELRDKLRQAPSPDDHERLQALAAPRLLTVWFNAWQYLNEEQVWGGLVVEVTQRLEEKLGREQRKLMRPWWSLSPWAWLQLLLLPMQWLAAAKYNWRTRQAALWLHCILPMFVVLVMVGVGVGVGIWQLQQHTDAQQPTEAANNTSISNTSMPASATALRDNSTVAINTSGPANATAAQDFGDTRVNKDATAGIAAAGLVFGLVAAIVTSVANCKSISNSFIEGRSYLKFKDHSSKVGYQHAVIKDLTLLGELLHNALVRFRSSQLQSCTAAAAAAGIAAKQAAAAVAVAETALAHAEAARISEQTLESEAQLEEAKQGLQQAIITALRAAAAARAAKIACQCKSDVANRANKGPQHRLSQDQQLRQQAEAAWDEANQAGDEAVKFAAGCCAATACHSCCLRLRNLPWKWCGPGIVQQRQQQLPISHSQQLRVVVFIDDLDRCRPSKVVEVLEAINIVLACSGFAVVVGMDKEFICKAIMEAYKGMDFGEAKAVEFLEKIVQVELTLPSPAKAELSTYLQKQCAFLEAFCVEPLVHPPPEGGVVKSAAAAADQAGTAVAADTQPGSGADARAWWGGCIFTMFSSFLQRDLARRLLGFFMWCAGLQDGQPGPLSGVLGGRGPTNTRAAVLSEIEPDGDPAPQPPVATDISNNAHSPPPLQVGLGEEEPAADPTPTDPLAEKVKKLKEQKEQRRERQQRLAIKQHYSKQDREVLQMALDNELLLDSTPRNIKRMLNRFLLAKYIMLEQDVASFGEKEERELLVWVLLWWCYPIGMHAVLQWKSKCQEYWSDLADLLEKMQQDTGQQQQGQVSAGSLQNTHVEQQQQIRDFCCTCPTRRKLLCIRHTSVKLFRLLGNIRE